MKTGLAAAALLAIVTGCGPNGGAGSSAAPKPAAVSPQVEKAVAIARELEAGGAADQVLQKHGLTEQQFEDLLYEIASDPVMSEQYSGKVGG